VSTETTQEAEAVTEEAAQPLLIAELPPPVADYGPVRLELMGHRYREGHLYEAVIAGTPFLRLDLEGGASEFYRPDAVYCITPATLAAPVPRAEIPARFAADDGYDDDEENLF
jgi:hypothetical protein